jgi:hypothetical protein
LTRVTYIANSGDAVILLEPTSLELLLGGVGVVHAVVLSITCPAVLERAPALLEGEESLEVDPMPAG